MFFFFFLIYLLLFNYSCMPFPPSLHPTPAEPISLPPLHPPPWICSCVLYSSSCNPLYPLSPPPTPSPALAIVTLFLTSMSLVIFCLLFPSIAYVPVKGDCWGIFMTVPLKCFSDNSNMWTILVLSSVDCFFLIWIMGFLVLGVLSSF